MRTKTLKKHTEKRCLYLCLTNISATQLIDLLNERFPIRNLIVQTLESRWRTGVEKDLTVSCRMKIKFTRRAKLGNWARLSFRTGMARTRG